MVERVSIGLLGVGTVGSGVLRVLSENAEDIQSRLKTRLVVTRALVRDVDRPRAATVDPELLTTDPARVLDDPEIQIVVELIGGVEPARSYVLQAIDRGKHVVTANKALLSRHGDEIFDAASRRGVDCFYEAAVCGGLPIIRTLREALASDRVRSVVGIVNGTSNYILTAMASRGIGYPEALAEAQARGFAEADPSLDVGGQDAAQKLAILSSLAFGLRVRDHHVHAEGITAVSAADLEVARAQRHAVKPVAIAARVGERLLCRVVTAWVPESGLLAHVNGADNAVVIASDALGSTTLVGQGAGQLPTGSAVVSDLIEVTRNIRLGATGRIPHWATLGEARRAPALLDPGETESRFYLRFSVHDEPGVLGAIAVCLGRRRVSLSVVHQDVRDPGGAAATIVAVTHRSREADLRAALAEIDRFPTTAAPTVHLPLLEPG